MRTRQSQTNPAQTSDLQVSRPAGASLPRPTVSVQRPSQNGLIEPTFGRSFKHDFSRVPTRRASLADGDIGTDAGADAGGSSADAGVAPSTDAGAAPQADGGTGGGSGSGGVTTPSFPTYAQIVGDAAAVTAMDAAWTSTKSATTRTSRREQGFWIKQNVGTGRLEFAPTFVGTSVGPGATGAADPGTKPADTNPGTATAVYTVGLFHTHTPMTYRTGGTRRVGPSGADNSFHTSNNVVGVVYDYTESPAGSGTIPSGHPLNSAAQLYHSGPNQRT
jgi:hypothetical protein